MDALIQYFSDGFKYITGKWERVEPNFIGHLQLVGVTLLIATAIAFPLGLLISRQRRLATVVLGILGVLYTIPSLAFLALVVPFTGLSQTTTIIVLVVYAQTMLVRNIMLGLTGVDPAILEAARGMGMSRWQVLRQVEMPLALPVIIAGFRIATLVTISVATIGALVGANGLGQLVLDNNDRRRAAGIILVVAIALVADLGYRLLEYWASGHTRTHRAITNPVGAKEA